MKFKTPSSNRRLFPPHAKKKLPEDRRSTRTVEKSRGRVETHILTTTTLSNDHLNWPGVQQAVRLERITIRRGNKTRTVQCALTSVSRKRANTDDLLRWLRGRWAVENTCFWVRDMTFDEDHCRIRTGTSPDVFSRIRNAAINAMKALGSTNLAATLRENAFGKDLLFAKQGIINL